MERKARVGTGSGTTLPELGGLHLRALVPPMGRSIGETVMAKVLRRDWLRLAP
jgi:hypothetical protein